MFSTYISEFGTGQGLWEGEMPPIAIGQFFGFEGRMLVVRESIIMLEDEGVVQRQYLTVSPT